MVRLSMTVAKVAVSIPESTLRLVEDACKRQKKTRSRLITEAIDAFLRDESAAQREQRYRDGYRKMPEGDPRSEVLAERAIAQWTSNDEWEP